MKSIISLLAAIVATLVMTSFASAASYKLVMCNAKQSAKTELSCAQRNIYHAQGTLQWVRETQKSRVRLLAGPNVANKLLAMHRDMTWLLRESRQDKAEAQRRLVAEIPLTNDWLTAVRLVQRVFPGSDAWLISCSSTEGGHGRWVPQAQGGTPGGWMQYMPGTFEHDWNRALAYARAHGFRIPAKAHSWYNALGQALAGGWAYGNDRPSGKWTGGGC